MKHTLVLLSAVVSCCTGFWFNHPGMYNHPGMFNPYNRDGIQNPSVATNVQAYNWQGSNAQSQKKNLFIGGGLKNGEEVMAKAYYDSLKTKIKNTDVTGNAKKKAWKPENTYSMCSAALKFAMATPGVAGKVMTDDFVDELAYPLLANMESVDYNANTNNLLSTNLHTSTDPGMQTVANFLETMKPLKKTTLLPGVKANPLMKLHDLLAKGNSAGLRLRKDLACFYIILGNPGEEKVRPFLVQLAFALVSSSQSVGFQQEQMWEIVGWFDKAMVVKDQGSVEGRLGNFINSVSYGTYMLRKRDDQMPDKQKPWKHGCSIQEIFPIAVPVKVTLDSKYSPPFPEEAFRMSCLGIFPLLTIVHGGGNLRHICSLVNGKFVWNRFDQQ